MKLVIIIGPPAVGKMTVGKELEKTTDLKLFHNHMSIELVNKFFDFGTETFERLDKAIRFAIFREITASELDGVIFTIVWDYDFKGDEEYIDEIIEIFAKKKAQICLVELQAELGERLRRNKLEDRLVQKASKRDVEQSEKSLLYFENNYRMASNEGEFPNKYIYKIDNTDQSAEKVAAMIKKKFNL